uniref:Kinesin motor domain-containing protein n=2 Tax=Aegilops tauschii subsp. strangulata TaxID=200361 RepID=A0A453LDX0_AEGTS
MFPACLHALCFAASIFAYGQTSSGKTYTMLGITEHSMAEIYAYIDQVHTVHCLHGSAAVGLLCLPLTCALFRVFNSASRQGVHPQVLRHGDIQRGRQGPPQLRHHPSPAPRRPRGELKLFF